MLFFKNFRRLAGSLLHNLGDKIGGIDLKATRENADRARAALGKIMQDADARFAQAEAEQERRSALGLLDYKVPSAWESLYYFRQGFRVSRSAEATAEDHWQGGPPQHEGATCPTCNKPLILFWDINVSDSRIREDGVQLFEGLTRLPLYYCPRRPESTIYRIEGRGRIRTIAPELLTDEETPFGQFPEVLSREPLQLEPIPREVAQRIILANEFDFQWLDKEDLEILSRFAGRKIAYSHDLDFDQFGGAPSFSQGHREIDCPNPVCQTRQMGNPHFERRRAYRMKELAVIKNPGGRAGAQVEFRICWKCLTVQADYGVD